MYILDRVKSASFVQVSDISLNAYFLVLSAILASALQFGTVSFWFGVESSLIRFLY
jgi:hypothetical protein